MKLFTAGFVRGLEEKIAAAKAKPKPKAGAKAAPVVDKMELARAAQTLAGVYKKRPVTDRLQMRQQLTSALFNHLSSSPEGARMAINALGKVK